MLTIGEACSDTSRPTLAKEGLRPRAQIPLPARWRYQRDPAPGMVLSEVPTVYSTQSNIVQEQLRHVDISMTLNC
jgi:hypothetical protein